MQTIPDPAIPDQDSRAADPAQARAAAEAEEERRRSQMSAAERALARQRAMERRREQRRATREVESEAATDADTLPEDEDDLAPSRAMTVTGTMTGSVAGEGVPVPAAPGTPPAIVTGAGFPLSATAAEPAPPGIERYVPPPPLQPGLERPRRRPWGAILAFLLIVAAPGGWLFHYLYTRAADEYHSVVAFSVRSEEPAPVIPEIAVPVKGGTPGALDSEIVSQFIRSQQLVATLDRQLDLRTIYNRRPEDWLFSLGQAPSIEALVAHWDLMVDVEFDVNTSLIEVTAYAFTPEDAQRIATAILEESTRLINSLSVAAREDAIRFAQRDLDEASGRLKELRLRLREFRDRSQTADPVKDVEIQMGVILELQKALAEALISRAELLDFTRATDSRVAEADRRIRAIEAQIAAEKAKLGSGAETADENGRELAGLIGQFEELKTDLRFAETAYVNAQAAFDEARIEARRKSRYLAAHVEPTLSQAPQYPQRLLLGALGTGALFAVWAVLMLLVANIRDRR